MVLTVFETLEYFPVLLHLYWILATSAALLSLLPIGSVKPFRDAVMLTACRGKLWEGRPRSSLGWFSDWAVPQSWFSHFYDIGALVNASVLAAYGFHLTSDPFHHVSQQQAGCWAGLLLLQLHLTRRLFESNFLQRYPEGSKMHVVAYIFGLSYYTVLPLSILPLPLKLNLSEPWWTAASRSSAGLGRAVLLQVCRSLGLIQLLGCGIFVAGNWLQWQSHLTLARLGRGAPSDKTGGYVVPTGGGFKWVSCPHYLGEMVIYLGLALLAGSHRCLPWIILSWVVVNLLLAAGPTHDWYRRTFPSYPPHRRAVIPWLY